MIAANQKFLVFDYRVGIDHEMFKTLQSWWHAWGQFPGPSEGMVPKDSTIVAYIDEKPVVAITLIKTNTEVAWAENLVSDPEIPEPIRKIVVTNIFKELEQLAKELGYKRVFLVSIEEKLTQRYAGLGYTPTAKCTSMTQEI